MPLKKVVLTCESVGEVLHGETIQIKATEQYFPVVLFNMLYKVFLTFESVDENYPKVWPFKWKLLSITFLLYCLFNAVQGGYGEPFHQNLMTVLTQGFFVDQYSTKQNWDLILKTLIGEQ